MTRASLAIAFCLLATPTLADAVTYKGTIGALPVVVEFSTDPQIGDAEFFGRYFYVAKGVDIPLHATQATRSKIGLAEEVPCNADLGNCPHAGDDVPTRPPLGPKWQLEPRDGGASLVGQFTSGGRNQPVTLTRVGTRPFDPAGGLMSLGEFASMLLWEGTLTPETSPYDDLKVTALPLIQGEPVEMNGATFRYVSDPRTKFQYPRLVDMAGYDITPANRYLEQRHWAMSLDALNCAAGQYQGFGWNGYNFDAGTLGYYDEEEVSVTYASPQLLSWTEAGSLSCGGPHPYNHREFHNLDLVAGTPLDLSRIFRGWIPRSPDGTPADLEDARADPSDYEWGPDEELAAFVKQHRRTDAELGFTGGEDDCPIDDLIDTNLAIGFKDADTVLFSLDGLPYVIQACADDLYETPIVDIVPLLSVEAENYFPVLAD